MKIEGSAALPIHITTNAPIGGPVLPVYLYTQATLGDRKIDSEITSVYSVSETELANGTFKLQGNVAAIPVIDYTSLDDSIPDIHPIPVYILNPSTPTPPAVNWWLAGGVNPANCVAAYQAKGAADYATSKVNLANSGVYDLSDGEWGAPIFDTLYGWSFDGFETYLDTGNLYQAITTNNCSVIIGYSELSGDFSSYLFGYYNEVNNPDYLYATFGIHNITTTIAHKYFLRISEQARSGTLPSVGYIAFCSNYTQYINGVLDTNANIESGDNGFLGNAIKIYIGCRHYKDDSPSDTQSHFSQVKINTIAFYNSVLTSTQIVAITTAIQAL